MNNKITKQAFREHIREIILDEAKKTKKKSKDIAPQEDVDIDFNMDDEQPSNDAMTPETGDAGDINPTVKSIQDSLQKAYAQAKQLGDAKLATQIGNTLTMLLRDQVLGQQQMAESINENIDWNDDQIYNSLIDMNQEQLVSDMLSTVEKNPSITLLEYCKQYED